MIEESIDERNSMSKPYRYYTLEEAQEPISSQAIEEASERIEKLYKKHAKPQCNIWEGIV